MYLGIEFSARAKIIYITCCVRLLDLVLRIGGRKAAKGRFSTVLGVVENTSHAVSVLRLLKELMSLAVTSMLPDFAIFFLPQSDQHVRDT